MEEKGSFTNPDLGDRYRLITEHYSLLIEYLGENRAPDVMRGLLLLYTKSLPNRRFLRDLISEIDGREKLISVLDKYFEYIRGGMASEG
jgi:tRNA-dihydrouridine synthase